MNIRARDLLSHSLQAEPSGLAAARILAASLNAVDPDRLLRNQVRREGPYLHAGDQVLDLDRYQRVILLGIGKAALAMTEAAADLLGDRVDRGFVLTKAGCLQISQPFQDLLKLYTGGHPLPDRSGQEAAQAILDQLSELTRGDLVIILLSGGGSTLFSLPAPGLTLEDLVQTNMLLLECGADIDRINTIRKHLSSVKGGGLARALSPAASMTLILSDVIGNRLDSVASGPTVPDPTTYQDALTIARDFRLSLPERVWEHLKKGQRGLLPETPKPGDHLFQDHSTLLIGSNQDACLGASRQAEKEGFRSTILPEPLTGEARNAGGRMAGLLKDLAERGQPLARPACLIAGGETTVTLTDTADPGRGGRNLELALSAVPQAAGLENCALISLSTDGVDGITDAAGAVVTGSTLERANQSGLSPWALLEGHNAYPFFKGLNDLLITGPTGTNVNDLCILFTF